jgi:hypothetical protein
MVRTQIKNACGLILSSFLEGNIICHSTYPYTLQQTTKHQKIDVALILHHSDCSCLRKSSGNLRKVVLARANIPIQAVAEQLQKYHAEKGRQIIAVRLQQKKSQRTWINPRFTEALEKMEQLQTKINQADGNDSAKRFWQKLLRLEEFECEQLDFGTLQTELGNFGKPFSVI